MQVTRRQFLVGAGAVTGGLALSTLGVNANPARAYAAEVASGSFPAAEHSFES